MSIETTIVEIRPAEGGDDAKLFTFDLFKMLSAYCLSKGWEVEILEMRDAGRHGYQQITFLVRGNGCQGALLQEAGGHRVQRVPPTEKRGRRQTSTVTVAVLPEPRDVRLHIPEHELRVETFRAGGPGGQHQNKTDTAVRVTHIPTGVTATSTMKSQKENRKLALAVLRTRLLVAREEAAAESRNQKRADQVGSGMRGDKRRTYNFKANRVTDHVTGRTVRDVKAVLRGNLDPLR